MEAGDIVQILLAAIVLYACSMLLTVSRKLDEILRLLDLLLREAHKPPHSRPMTEH